jgi:lipopolysaccharide transport system permease protein
MRVLEGKRKRSGSHVTGQGSDAPSLHFATRMSVPASDMSTSAPAPRVYRPVKRRVRFTDLWTSLRVARMIGLRDLKVKYKQAALGPLWLLIGPLGMLVAITIAFSGVTDVDTGGIPYLLFALTGLTVWTFIQLSATLGAQSIVGNASLVRRSPMPRVALVTGSMIGNFPPVAVMFLLALIGSIVTGHLPVQALLLPLLIAWLITFTLSLSLAVGALTARFRDVGSMLPLIIQAGIFVTPVGYSLKGSPANIHILLTLNPVSGLIEAFRWAMLDLPDPQWSAVLIAAIWTVVLGIVGWRVFTRMEVEFADFV